MNVHLLTTSSIRVGIWPFLLCIFITEQNIWYVSRTNGWVKNFIWNLWNDLLDDFYSNPLRPPINLKKPAQATKVSSFLHTHLWTHTHMQVHTYTPSSETMLWSRIFPVPWVLIHLNQILYIYPWHLHAPIKILAGLLLWNIFLVSLFGSLMFWFYIYPNKLMDTLNY